MNYPQRRWKVSSKCDGIPRVPDGIGELGGVRERGNLTVLYTLLRVCIRKGEYCQPNLWIC